jgi:hypothetical protein
MHSKLIYPICADHVLILGAESPAGSAQRGHRAVRRRRPTRSRALRFGSPASHGLSGHAREAAAALVWSRRDVGYALYAPPNSGHSP